MRQEQLNVDSDVVGEGVKTVGGVSERLVCMLDDNVQLNERDDERVKIAVRNEEKYRKQWYRISGNENSVRRQWFVRRRIF